MLIEHVVFFLGSSAGVKASKHESHAQDGGTLFATVRCVVQHVRETSVRRSCHGFGILNGVHPSDGAGEVIVLRSQPLARATGASPVRCPAAGLLLDPSSPFPGGERPDRVSDPGERRPTYERLNALTPTLSRQSRIYSTLPFDNPTRVNPSRRGEGVCFAALGVQIKLRRAISAQRRMLCFSSIAL
jgi:hypothetical protein